MSFLLVARMTCHNVHKTPALRAPQSQLLCTKVIFSARGRCKTKMGVSWLASMTSLAPMKGIHKQFN